MERKAKMHHRVVLAGMACLLLGGCSWLKDWPPATDDTALMTQTPEARIIQTPGGTWIDPASMAQAAPFEPASPDEGALKRLEKVEREMANMRSDLNTMIPAITKLAEAQGNLQQVLSRLPTASRYASASESGTRNEFMGRVTPPAPPAAASPGMPVPLAANQSRNAGWAPQTQPMAVAVQPAQPAPSMQSQVGYTPPGYRQQGTGGQDSTVNQIRFGEHTGKTRIVLDMNRDATFSYQMTQDGTTLYVDLPRSAWGHAPRSGTPKSGMVSSWEAQTNGQGGVRLVVRLRRPASINWVEAIPAEKGLSDRIVIDLARA